jgi:hypothetical protein
MQVLCQTAQSFFGTATHRFLIYFTPRCIKPPNFGPTDRPLYNIEQLSEKDSGFGHHFIFLVDPAK